MVRMPVRRMANTVFALRVRAIAAGRYPSPVFMAANGKQQQGTEELVLCGVS